MSRARARGTPHGPERRWAASATAAGTLLAALVAPLSAGTPAMAADGNTAPPRPLSGASTAWSGSGWASTTGNTVSDVAKTIGTAGSTLNGTGVGIALIDTGVASVPGLPAAKIVNGPDLSFDSQAANLRYQDTFGHGTHLAGIMVGNDPATGFKGIAPGAKLTSIKVGARGGVVDVTQVIAALNWVVAHKNDDPANPIKVICLAYGTDANANPDNDPLIFAVENAYRNGVLVTVAGGNNGTSLGRFNSPATSAYMLSVGSAATQGTLSQADDTLSSFTSIDSYNQLDVVAPGEGIVSLRVPGSAIDLTYPAARVGENYFRGSGSSQATAVVSAAAALLYQKSPTATPYQIRAWIRESARPLTGTYASRTMGELDMAKALSRSKPNYTLSGGYSSGLGTMQAARGSSNVVHNNATLSGANDIFGAFSNSSWVTAANNKTAWQGGLFMGKRMTGDGWTGTSWASKTWAPATWTSADWAGQAWYDSTWANHTWSGRYWSGGTWSGRYWSSSTWQSKTFAAKVWASASWA